MQIRINFLVGNHPSQIFPANQDAFPRWKSSLTDFSNKSGCISPLGIIPPRHFLLIRMHFSVGNHPSQIFLANQDQSPRWKSSLTDFSSKSGCISPTEIIPHRLFQQIRMHFLVGNHPSQIFPVNQDAFPRRKSSLPEIFSKSGCISPTRIIPPGHFQQIRMHFSAGNHPSRKFSADQDAFLRWKSSLPEIFSRSGCISPLGIISPGNFQQIRMHFSNGNHLSRKFSANQDAFLRRKSSLQDIFSKSGCISTLGIIPPEIIPLRIISPQTIPSPTKKGLSGL